jgi:hypothetical protein
MNANSAALLISRNGATLSSGADGVALLFSANGAATYQPSPKGWVRSHHKSRGPKARNEMLALPMLCVDSRP